ncbi:MAG: rhodanese-like domain-containing protein [Thermoleophilia bacterium]|nr:rhodanese-like domain-containing protein [Thermoleophilia bacterium]
MTSTITRAELRERLDSGEELFLVEVLPREAFERVHLPGAINIPRDELDRLAPQLVPDKDAEVVTYCANTRCQASAKAAERLTELGYANVRDYVGGKQDWLDAGLPTETEARALAP